MEVFYSTTREVVTFFVENFNQFVGIWKFSAFHQNARGLFYTERSLHGSLLCLLHIRIHSTFCVSFQRESIFLPPSLGGDIHATDKFCFPMIAKTRCALYEKLAEENQLENLILSFPVPSLPRESKVIHSKYPYQIVNNLGTDNREAFRVKAISQLGPVLWAPNFCQQKLQENWANFPQKLELFSFSSPDVTPSHPGSTSHLGQSRA